MVKDLNDLLPVDHFFNVAVQSAEHFLLAGVIRFAALATEADI